MLSLQQLSLSELFQMESIKIWAGSIAALCSGEQAVSSHWQMLVFVYFCVGVMAVIFCTLSSTTLSTEVCLILFIFLIQFLLSHKQEPLFQRLPSGK